MRLLFILPFIIAAITTAAGLSVNVAASLYDYPVYLAHLWAFLGIAVLTVAFTIMGETVFEDIVKAGICIVISLPLFDVHIPPLIPCTSIIGVVLASATNQLIQLLQYFGWLPKLN